MHDMSRSHIRLVVKPIIPQGLENGKKEKRGQMVSALEAIEDAANSEEAFAALQSWNHSPDTQKADAYAVEQELYKGSMEVMRLMLEENSRSRGTRDVGPSIEARPKEQEIEEQRPANEISEEQEFVRLGKRRRHVRNYESLFGTIHIERLGYGECGHRMLSSRGGSIKIHRSAFAR